MWTWVTMSRYSERSERESTWNEKCRRRNIGRTQMRDSWLVLTACCRCNSRTREKKDGNSRAYWIKNNEKSNAESEKCQSSFYIMMIENSGSRPNMELLYSTWFVYLQSKSTDSHSLQVGKHFSKRLIPFPHFINRTSGDQNGRLVKR